MNKIKKIYSFEQINSQISKVALKLNKVYKNEELVLVIILAGAFNYAALLSMKLNMKTYFLFIKASSYSGTTKTKKPILSFLDKDHFKKTVHKKNVLIIEDLIDTGESLLEISKFINTSKPKTLSITALFGNEKRIKTNIKEYFVFEKKPNGFLVGFGLDYYDTLRNLPYIGIINDK